jgi:hypothetical protein
MAAFIPRHNYIQWCSSTPAKVTLRPMVKCRGPGIQPNLCSENQLCVPTMSINGESFRLKDKRKAGLLAAPAKIGRR